jgi:hypothetical protein
VRNGLRLRGFPSVLSRALDAEMFSRRSESRRCANEPLQRDDGVAASDPKVVGFDGDLVGENAGGVKHGVAGVNAPLAANQPDPCFPVGDVTQVTRVTPDELPRQGLDVCARGGRFWPAQS